MFFSWLNFGFLKKPEPYESRSHPSWDAKRLERLEAGSNGAPAGRGQKNWEVKSDQFVVWNERFQIDSEMIIHKMTWKNQY